MKILNITWKGWLDLWKSLFYAVGAIIFGLLIILTRGTIKSLIRAWRLLNKAIGVHPGRGVGRIRCGSCAGKP